MSATEIDAPLARGVIQRLAAIFPPSALALDLASRTAYSYDNSRRQGLPQAVLFATERQQIVALVALCREQRLPLTVRGRGTGTTGASVPDQGGVVLSLERMARIVEIDPANRTVRVEPGVTNRQLQQALAKEGFFWPPDPTSAAVCTIGGNLGYTSAGPHAVKYGTPRDNTLALTAVTGAGEILHTGVATTKGVVGYDLTRLLIGSEGTLAIITEALLKLTPLPEAQRTLRLLYDDIAGATSAVSAIMAQPVTPCALEFMDSGALNLIRDYPGLDLPPEARAMLMIEVDGSEACLDAAVAAISEAARNPSLRSLRSAANASESKALWQARAALSPAMRRIAPHKINEDVVVPVSRIPELISGLERLSQQYAIPIVNFGHAGNGNIHVNLLIDPHHPQQAAAAGQCLDQVFDLVLQLHGTLSGEHGVGLEKRDFIDRELDPIALGLMRSLRRIFDPDAILNPGKMLPP